MNNLFIIFRRELAAYFNSAIAYIFLVVFVIFTNGLFMMQFYQIGKADMRLLFNSLSFILNIFVPAIAMRLWAEDKKGNTFELLLTFPMRPRELVLGKFLASFVFYLFALAATFTVPLMLCMIGHPEPGHIIGGYLGAALLGGLFLAIGIFISGLCKDQIVAFILSVIATFAVFFTGTAQFALFVDGWLPGVGSFTQNYLGAAGHLIGFSKGVIDLKDVAYFIVTSGVFLFLNGLSLEGRLRPKAKIVFSAAAIVCLFSTVLINWLLHDLPLGRFDVTEGKAYTVSDASARILKGLKVPVRVKLYISPVEGMPTLLKTLERDIVDKFEELRIASAGKFTYKIIHVESSSEDKSDAFKKTLEAEGIAPFQVESIQKDEVGVKLIYSTLVIEYKEKINEIIPRVVSQNLHDLEYQLLARIYKMTMEEKPKIAIYAPIRQDNLALDVAKMVQGGEDARPQKDIRDDFKTLTLLMRNNGYDASRIALSKNDLIPDKTRLLLLLNPGQLTTRQQFEINKFLFQGGIVFLAAQGFEYTFARRPDGLEAVPTKLNLDINKLTEKWGVKINDEILFDERNQVISLTTGQTIGPFAVQMPVQFANQIIIDEANMNKSEPITSRVPSLAFLWGSVVDVAEAALKPIGLQSTVLFTTSEKSWRLPNNGQTNLTAENTKIPALDKLGGKQPVAVMVEGQFSDTFGKSVPNWEEGEAGSSAEMSKPSPGKLLVVGSSKAFDEDLIQNPGNIMLFANIIDGMTLGEDLIKIRSKVSIARDIRRLTNGEKIGYRFLTVLAVPAFLFLVALGSSFLRRKEKKRYLESAFNEAD